MTVHNYITPPNTPAPPTDPYEITPAVGGIFTLRYHGALIDSGYDIGSMEAARLLHSALIEAEDYATRDMHIAQCSEDYGTYLGAASAAHQAEADGKWLVAVGCPRCGGWHLREGR